MVLPTDRSVNSDNDDVNIIATIMKIIKDKYNNNTNNDNNNDDNENVNDDISWWNPGLLVFVLGPRYVNKVVR